MELLGLVLQTTGGYNSESNGQVERSNRFDANVIRPGLSTMNILIGPKLPSDLKINKFWCLALGNGTLIHRMIYNRMREDLPHFLVHGYRQSIKQLIPLGCIITVINSAKTRKKLDDRGV